MVEFFVFYVFHKKFLFFSKVKVINMQKISRMEKLRMRDFISKYTRQIKNWIYPILSKEQKLSNRAIQLSVIGSIVISLKGLFNKYQKMNSEDIF